LRCVKNLVVPVVT